MTPQDIKRHSQIDAVARYLATPWDGLLNLLESYAGSRVSLVKFEPDAASGRLALTGRAVSTEDLATYLRALETDPRLSGVLLQRHGILRSEAGNPVEFMIGASWNANARDAVRATMAAASTPQAQEIAR
jgi:Tfp pilus assembly protein PilN